MRVRARAQGGTGTIPRPTAVRPLPSRPRQALDGHGLDEESNDPHGESDGNEIGVDAAADAEWERLYTVPEIAEEFIVLSERLRIEDIGERRLCDDGALDPFEDLGADFEGTEFVVDKTENATKALGPIGEDGSNAPVGTA